MSSSPWGKITPFAQVNLDDIMSEQLAADLQEKENKKYSPSPEEKELLPTSEHPFEDVCESYVVDPEMDEQQKSDVEIAKMLQQQFDKEYDDCLKRSEEKFNGSSKVSISFSNYRRAPLNQDFDSESEPEELEDLRDKKDWDRFDITLRELGKIPPCGYKNDNGNIITKHDATMSSRKNACKMMSFPPEFETGDGAGFDMKISNKVFNSLKIYSKNEQAKKNKSHDKRDDLSTATFSVDAKTRILLYKMFNNGVLKQINGVVSIGKEAIVLHADRNMENLKESEGPRECAIKVFKTTLSEYKQRDKYIRDDYRFKERFGRNNKKIATLKLVQLWAEKEMHNLQRLHNAGILCPEVVHLKQHVLVMSFIGESNKAAPKLKHAILSERKNLAAYKQIVQYMKTMYTECNLIHADLSEYNILWHNNNCYIIDVSQSVEPSHENAFYFLYRDCENICNFFSKREVPDIATPDELFKEITKYDYANRITLSELQESIKMKPHLVDRPGIESTYNFDEAWERSRTGTLPDQCSSSGKSLCTKPVKA